MKKVAVVTGGNRGLGFETCRELAQKNYTVILTCRDSKKGETAAETLRKEKLDVHFCALDLLSQKSIQDLKSYLIREFNRCDVLVNNAGIFPDRSPEDKNEDHVSALLVPVETMRKGFETNTLGPYQLMQALVPLMVKNNYGRVVNVSSGMGQLLEMNGQYPAYRVSKTALNALTKIFADELKDKNILVNSICPGWVRTDMGGPNGERTIPEGADTIVWAATLPDGFQTGSFFRDREEIPW